MIWECWYQGATQCEQMRGRMGRDEVLLDIAQAVLLGFAQSGGFRVDVEFLQSDFYTSMQSVNFGLS